jgi:hypothetical protein
MQKNNWMYNNQEFTTADIGDYVGFVYIINNITKGKFYIGKKNFYKVVKLKPLKGKTRNRLKKSYTNWEVYTGSSNELNNDILAGDQITKTIIKLCTSKASMTYYELKHQMAMDAMFRDDCYNGIINVRLSSVCKDAILRDS